MKRLLRFLALILMAVFIVLISGFIYFEVKIAKENDLMTFRSNEGHLLRRVSVFRDSSFDDFQKFKLSRADFLQKIRSWIDRPYENDSFLELQRKSYRLNDKVVDNSSFLLRKIEFYALANKFTGNPAAAVFIILKKIPIDKNFEGSVLIETIELNEKPSWKVCEKDKDCQVVSKFCPLFSTINKDFETEYSRYAEAKQRAQRSGFDVYTPDEKKSSRGCGQKSFFDFQVVCKMRTCQRS